MERRRSGLLWSTSIKGAKKQSSKDQVIRLCSTDRGELSRRQVLLKGASLGNCAAGDFRRRRIPVSNNHIWFCQSDVWRISLRCSDLVPSRCSLPPRMALKRLLRAAPPWPDQQACARMGAGRLIETLTGKPYETALQEFGAGAARAQALRLLHRPAGRREHRGLARRQGRPRRRHQRCLGVSRSIDSTGGLMSSAAPSSSPMPASIGRRRRGRRQARWFTPRSRRCAPTPAPAVPSPWRSTVALGLGSGARAEGAASVPARRLVGRAELRLLPSCPTGSSR